jgi:hypothetical protein
LNNVHKEACPQIGMIAAQEGFNRLHNHMNAFMAQNHFATIKANDASACLSVAT